MTDLQTSKVDRPDPPDLFKHIFDSGTLKCQLCGADYFAVIRKEVWRCSVGASVEDKQ